MRSLFVLFILACSQCQAVGQTITYDIPTGLEKYISQEDYHFLVDTSIAAVNERYRIDFVKGGTIQLAGGQQMGAFNLDNLIIKCAAIKDRAGWPAVIKDHFHQIYKSFDAKEKVDLSSYEKVKQYLSIRIYPKQTVDEHGGPGVLVTREDLEGTYTLLMLDLPGAFTAVQRNNFNQWKKDVGEVFRAALDNVDSQKVEKVTKATEVHGNQLEITLLGNEDYAASYALDLERNSPELIGEWGCAMAIPNKGLVTLCKISHDKPVDFVNYIQLTKTYMENSFQEHPQRISDQFFWYYHGTFTPIHVETRGDGSVNVISPYGLTQLMTKQK